MRIEMIDIVVMNNQAFVWDAEDVDKLRRCHRIIGSLIGCLPRAPMQNLHPGLPLKLLPEEAALAQEKGFARLVQYERLDAVPTLEEMEKFNAMREDSHQKQTLFIKEECRKKLFTMLDDIVEGKRKKKASQVKVLQKVELVNNPATRSQTQVEVIDLTMEANEEPEIMEIPQTVKESTPNQVIDREEVLREELEKIDTMTVSNDSMNVQLFSGCPWITESQAKPVQWTFPTTKLEKLRYKIFKDLWEKGFFLTTGFKFACDFLVYPGDPVRHHASHLAICICHQQPISGYDLVCKGRLATNVKKTALFCSVNEKNEVCYQSLQWTGMN